MISSSVHRSNTLKARMADIIGRVGRKVERGLRAAATTLLEESKELVPVDTTILRDDGHVRQESFSLSTVMVVGYGTKGVVMTQYSRVENKVVTRIPYEYAIYVHECFTHDHSESGGQAFFLIVPILLKHPEMIAALRAAL